MAKIEPPLGQSASLEGGYTGLATPVPSRWSPGRRSPDTPESTAINSLFDAAAVLPFPKPPYHLGLLYKGLDEIVIRQHVPSGHLE